MRVVENSIKVNANPAKAFLDRMQFFYELFPYPNRPWFLRPDPNGSIDAHAGFSALVAKNHDSKTSLDLSDLHIRDVRHAFSKNKKIALVGCGTDEPLLFRLLHPHNPIVGIDLSLRSLQRAQRKLTWHRVKPIRLIHGDACLALDEESPISHIQCFGVLHHQPDPRKLLSAMARALEKDGTLRLMIYSSTGRRLERGLQRKFLNLWEARNAQENSNDSEITPTRFSSIKLNWTSVKLLCWRLCLPFISPKTLARRFAYVGFSRARIADAFLHPSDHPLSLKDTLTWASELGLELIAHEAKSYDLGWMISPAPIKTPIETLVSEEERGNIASNIVLVFRKVGADTWTSK